MDLETTEAIERLNDRIDLLETTLREDIEEVRRHAALLNEATRGDIRLVAGAVAHLTVKVDSLKH